MASKSPGLPSSSCISTSSTTSSSPNTQPAQQHRPPPIVSSETESEPEAMGKAQAASGPKRRTLALELETASSVSQPSSEDSDDRGRIQQDELETDWGSASGLDDVGSGLESGDGGRICGSSRFTSLEEIVPAAAPTSLPSSDEDSESNLSWQSDGYAESSGSGGNDSGGEGEHDEPADEASPRAYSLELTNDNGDHGITDLPQAGEAAPQITKDGVYQKSNAESSFPNTPTSKALGSSLDTEDSTENTEGESDRKPTSKRFTPGRRRGQQIDRFNPEYVEELNDAISSTNSLELCPNGLRGSWVIGSWWSHTEKHKFFNLIARIGRHDVVALASKMKTKSIVECRAYLGLLKQAVVEANENLLRKSGRLFRMADMPAAMEISDECAEALEEEAQFLENRTVADEQRREKNKWGKSWLLDGNISEHIEDLYEGYENGSDEEGLETIKEFAPEAELLSVLSMLNLSEYVFMNGPKESWQTLGGQRPSIRYTAFIDIHTLVVSFTRKLVSASIFMAQSRLRSTNSKILKSSKESDVRPSDVEAATNTLGLPPNMKEYWAKVPRRLGLDVLEGRFYILNGSKNKVLTPLDEVERFMHSEETFRVRPATKEELGASDREEPAQQEDEGGTAHANSEVEDENEHSDNSTQTSVFANSSQTSLSGNNESDGDETLRDGECTGEDDFIVLNLDVHHEPNKIRKRLDREYQAHIDQEESYLESRDQRDSQEEERRLWQLLGKQPERLTLEESPKVLAMPRGRRKRPADIHDWANDVEYYAPWETNKKRKVEKAGVVTSEPTPRAKGLKLRSATSARPDRRVEMEESSSWNIGPRFRAIRGAEGARLRKLARASRSPSYSSGYTSQLESMPAESDAEEADDESEAGASQEEV